MTFVSTLPDTDPRSRLLDGLKLPVAQQPSWPDRDALDGAIATLATYPPLVFAGECDVLKDRMAEAARGEAFVLQGGDCAETFASATADKLMDDMQAAMRNSRAASLKAAQAMAESYTAMVSGVLLGMSEALQQGGAGKAAAKSRK